MDLQKQAAMVELDMEKFSLRGWEEKSKGKGIAPLVPSFLLIVAGVLGFVWQ